MSQGDLPLVIVEKLAIGPFLPTYLHNMRVVKDALISVHHVDGNRQNNAHSNLVVCQDRRYHNLLHVRQRVLAAGGDPNTQRICFMCKQPKLFSELVGGATKASSSNRCRPCANQDLRNRKLERRSA